MIPSLSSCHLNRKEGTHLLPIYVLIDLCIYQVYLPKPTCTYTSSSEISTIVNHSIQKDIHWEKKKKKKKKNDEPPNHSMSKN